MSLSVYKVQLFTTGQRIIGCFMWNVTESKDKSLMMWSLAAIFDFLHCLSGPSSYFKASAPQQTWECNSAVSGSPAIFKTHFSSLAPPPPFSLSISPVWLREELMWSGRECPIMAPLFSFWLKGGRTENRPVCRRKIRVVQLFENQ